MLLLVLDVPPKIVYVRWANREYSISALPVEVGQGLVFGLDPFRRLPLDLGDKVGHGNRTRHVARDVHMVLNPTNDERWYADFRQAPAR